MTETAQKVLFVCVSNAGKSVMAQGLMRHAAPSTITASSAGTAAKTSVNALSAQVLTEVGVDVSAHRPTQLTEDLIRVADLAARITGRDSTTP